MAITKTVTVRLEVLAVPDFFPAVNPMDLEITKGGVARYICSIVPNATFTGRVRLSADWFGANFSRTEIGVGETSEMSIDTTLMDTVDYNINVRFEEV
jgi:hypothetical protein